MFAVDSGLPCLDEVVVGTSRMKSKPVAASSEPIIVRKGGVAVDI
jgi:hypothetical protein